MMNLDSPQINMVFNAIPFPIGKSHVIQMAKQFGMNDQIIGILQRLPDKTYNSANELKSDLRSLGNLGGLKL